MKQNRSSGDKGRLSAKAAPSRAALRLLPAGYRELLDDLKARVRAAQIKAAVAANRESIQLYWDIGRLIVERQERESWGKSVVERLAADIQRSFPGIKGFSLVNVWRMRSFYLAYRLEEAILSQAVIELAGEKLSQAVTELKHLGKSAQAVPKLASACRSQSAFRNGRRSSNRHRR